MASYEIAVKKTLIHEGGFQNDPQDHANWSSGVVGVGQLVGTKYGITAVDLPGVDIENLTEEEAVAYYAEHYWKTLYSQINYQSVADKLFDLGVLFGVGTAVHMMQLTLKMDLPKDVYGQFGPQTLNNINQADERTLYQGFTATMISHAFAVATANPNERKFLAGWGRRINCSDDTLCEKCKQG